MNSARARARRFGGTSTMAFAVVASLGSCGRGGHDLDSFHMVDLSTVAMFEQLSVGLDTPFVVELPPARENPRFDVSLTNTSERAVLDELVRLDPYYGYEKKPGVLLFYPVAEAAGKSPYVARIQAFRMTAGAADVLASLVRKSGLQVDVSSQKIAARRPVTIDVTDAVLRDVIAEVARQAHVAIVADHSTIQITPMGVVGQAPAATDAPTVPPPSETPSPTEQPR
jgi:hypothetical protein